MEWPPGREPGRLPLPDVGVALHLVEAPRRTPAAPSPARARRAGARGGAAPRRPGLSAPLQLPGAAEKSSQALRRQAVFGSDRGGRVRGPAGARPPPPPPLGRAGRL